MRVQAVISDPILEQKFMEQKEELEKLVGVEFSWNQFWQKVLIEYMTIKDHEKVNKTGT